MKKILLLALLIVLYNNLLANLTQTNWRWRNNDGDENTASWKDAEMTSITLNSNTEIIRLRTIIDNNSSNSFGTQLILQYSKSNTGPWTNIDDNTQSNHFIMAGSNSFISTNSPTTFQLSSSNSDQFITGKVLVTYDNSNFWFNPYSYTEFEYAIMATNSTELNTPYYFKVSNVTAASSNSIPSLNTGSVLPVKLTNFTVNNNDRRVVISWTTAMEINNDYFEVVRSNDTKTWKSVSKIIGHATISNINNYIIYDENPLEGVSYYMLKQFDTDGHFNLSDVKTIHRNSASKTTVTVSPNPAHGVISFSINNNDFNNVEASLINVSGSILYKKIIKALSANSVNKFPLQQPLAAGIYTLILKANGLFENIKVVVL